MDSSYTFLLPLAVGRLPGVGKVTGERLAKLGIETVADLRRLDVPTLQEQFGQYGLRLYGLARGVDDSEVVPDRPTQSMSVEDTFERDVLLAETDPMIRSLAEKLWSASRKESRVARTVVLTLKTSEFKILTLAKTIDGKINDSARRLPAYRENKRLLTMKITTEGTQKQKISSRGIGSCKEYGTFSDRPPARCRPVVAGACRYSSSE